MIEGVPGIARGSWLANDDFAQGDTTSSYLENRGLRPLRRGRVEKASAGRVVILVVELQNHQKSRADLNKNQVTWMLYQSMRDPTAELMAR